MAKIICKISLLSFKQIVYIQSYKYDGKSITETYQMPLKDIPDFIASQNNIDEVCLAGPKAFIKKIEQDTHNIEINKYSKKEKTIFKYI